MIDIDLPTAKWVEPLLHPSRYKGLHGGRSSGKSHCFGEMVVEASAMDPDLCIVCIREVQKSLKFSAKRLIEQKIQALGLGKLFDVQHDIIKRIGGDGVILFQGMSDATAESIKSLEGFGVAWFEEAQRASQRSIDLLLPTIRIDGSEIWFSWNPDQPDDPVEKLLFDPVMSGDAIVVEVNYIDNPHCPDVVKRESELHRKRDPETFDHVWLGKHNTKSDDQVLCGKCVIEEFEVSPDWDGPYFGADWGFSTDPNALIKCYVAGDDLMIEQEAYGHGIEIEDTPDFFGRISGSDTHTVRGDSARPEIISYMRRHGFPKLDPVEKWKGSVEDGVSRLRSFGRIVIHTRCTKTAEESRLWKYKRDRLTGDILPILIDKNNHLMDALRYAIAPLIKRKPQVIAW